MENQTFNAAFSGTVSGKTAFEGPPSEADATSNRGTNYKILFRRRVDTQ